MAEASPSLSVNIINVNELNFEMKRQRLTEWTF